MVKYILKRLLLLIPVIIGVSFVVFIIVSMTPGDAALIILPYGTEEELAQVRTQLGLDDPLIVQYFRYLLNMFRGDLGTSYYSNKDVFAAYMERLPATALLAVSSMVVSVVIAVPLGIYSATHQYSRLDHVCNVFALFGNSMPNFWIGLLLIMFFALKLRLLPSGGSSAGFVSLILPALTLGVRHIALVYRMTRSSMLDVVRSDYIRTARAKGLKEKVVINKHAMRNAWIPVITVIGTQIGTSLGGSVVTETVFSWPGVGRMVVDSINRKDRPMVMGCLVLTTILISLTNLLVDILYAYVDPRVKAEYKKK